MAFTIEQTLGLMKPRSIHPSYKILLLRRTILLSWISKILVNKLIQSLTSIFQNDKLYNRALNRLQKFFLSRSFGYVNGSKIRGKRFADRCFLWLFCLIRTSSRTRIPVWRGPGAGQRESASQRNSEIPVVNLQTAFDNRKHVTRRIRPTVYSSPQFRLRLLPSTLYLSLSLFLCHLTVRCYCHCRSLG